MITELKNDTTAQNSVTEPLVTFYKAYPDSLPAMSADRSALGTIPTRAYQYCEALTTASAFGWYAFPAATVSLYFDGIDIYQINGNEKVKILSEQLSDMDQWWNTNCPEHLVDMAPPFLTSLGIPGYLQVWSGLLIQTRRNWSSLIRPIANMPNSNQFFCFEGIIETDRYAPAPLFINIKLQATHTPIVLSGSEPLFQIQPIHRECYSKVNHASSAHHNIEMQSISNDGLTDNGWNGYSNTIRNIDPIKDMHRSGQYAADTRKRAKKHT